VLNGSCRHVTTCIHAVARTAPVRWSCRARKSREPSMDVLFGDAWWRRATPPVRSAPCGRGGRTRIPDRSPGRRQRRHPDAPGTRDGARSNPDRRPVCDHRPPVPGSERVNMARTARFRWQYRARAVSRPWQPVPNCSEPGGNRRDRVAQPGVIDAGAPVPGLGARSWSCRMPAGIRLQ